MRINLLRINLSVCALVVSGGMGTTTMAQNYTVDATGLPILNSNAGAVGVLYLDFTGGTFSGTTWAPFNNTHSESETDPSTYVGSERQDIYDLWLDVSAHFAMFDINVTTVAPDKTTTPTGHQLIVNKTGGGSANTNVFGFSTDAPDQARGVNSAINMRNRSSSITHEFGHILGLNHDNEYDQFGNYVAQYDSASADGIGSLMGIDYGFTSNQVSRFSSWQQSLTLSNQTPQDDRAVIAAKLIAKYNEFTGNAYTGDGYRPDEHGNTQGTATALSLVNEGDAGNGLINVSAQAAGIIERLTDTDMFELNWAGGDFSATAEAIRSVSSGSDSKLEYASSLGMLLSLYNDQGQLIVQDGGTPEDRSGTGLVDITFSNDVDATVSATGLAAGTYYLAITSLGEYDDVGAYTLDFSGTTLVPEPNSFAVLLGGVALLLRRRR